jgi:hypothetical protein
MKSLICAVIAVMLVSSLAFAETAAKKFDGNNWLALSKRDRAGAVTAYINAAKSKGIVIKNTPIFYAKKLDAFYARENMRTQPVENVLKTTMVMEYDWLAPGKTKDEIAKQWLGPDLYEKNKERRSKAK